MDAPTTEPSGTVSNTEPTSAYFHHDWESDRSLSTRIVAAIAEMTGKEGTDVDCIYDRLDPDSLDAIFESVGDERPRSDGVLWFSLDDCTVTVYGTGFVIVQRTN